MNDAGEGRSCVPATAARVAHDASAPACATTVVTDEMMDATCELMNATCDVEARQRARAHARAQKTTMTSMTKTKCAGEPSRCTVDFILDATELVEWRRRFVGDAVHQIPGRGEHSGENVGVDGNEPRVARGLHPQLRGLG